MEIQWYCSPLLTNESCVKDDDVTQTTSSVQGMPVLTTESLGYQRISN